MKKRLACIVLVTVLFGLLSNVNVVYSNQLYTIRRVSGGSTFSLDRKIVFGKRVREALRTVWYCEYPMAESHGFSTVSQMFDRIQSDNWTIYDIDNFYYSENYSFDMFDIENPVDAALPDDVRVSTISWRGNSYSFSLESDQFEYGYLFLYGQNELEREFKNDYKNLLKSETKLRESGGVTTVTGKHPHYRDPVTVKRFEINDGRRTLYIQKIDISAAMGNKVEIYGFGDDVPFYVRLDNYTGPLSTDWLKCFGVTPIEKE